jgi:hsp70-interacting protein
MPDLNELLKWSIMNSASGQQGSTAEETSAGSNGNDHLSLRFNPATTNPSTPSSALHPNDPQYRINTDDISPASTPGPTTPHDLPVALPRAVRSVEESNAILEMLMGKPDSTTMREKLEYAQNEGNEVDKRIEALDDFEMVRVLAVRQGVYGVRQDRG